MKFFQKNDPVNYEIFPDIDKRKKTILPLLSIYPTPIFMGDKAILQNRYSRLEEALVRFWGEHIIAYSFKTNYDIARSNVFKSMGSWAEVVSQEEYNLAKKIGFPGEKIIFNGPLKTTQVIKRALVDGALIHLDNKNELMRLSSLPKRLLRGAKIGMRIRTNTAQGVSRFGFSIHDGQAHDAAKYLQKKLNILLTSVHAHLGTDTDSLDLYKKEITRVGQLVADLYLMGHAVRFLDAGGGFVGGGIKPIHKKQWTPHPIEDYIATIAEVLKKVFINKIMEKITLVVEPGRYLVDDAVVFVTKVYDVERNLNFQPLVIDAAVTMMPLVYYRPQIVRVFSDNLQEKKSGTYMPSVIYGGSCREDDILFRGHLPPVGIGDYVIFYCAGAYNQSMGSDFIFKKPKTLII